MASKRRGGLRPPELRGTLGTLLRTTTGVVRDAIERGAREGRARLDDARATRRRQDALADLGELVLDLIRRGEIDLAELPEARDLVRQLDELDHEPADEPAPPPRAPLRRRFDDRAHATADDGTVSSGAAAAAAAVRVPAAPPTPATSTRANRPTVPARTSRPEISTARTPTKPIKGLWRPDVDAPGPPDNPAHRRSSPPPDPLRKGGISFDDDDLNEYMHPDDVPPKGAAKDPDDGEA